MLALRQGNFTTFNLCTGVFLLFSSSIILAQPSDLQFDRLTIKDGLPNTRVQVIYQDRRGFMWFGTRGGLARYDGYTTKVYRPIEGDSTSLSGPLVWAIAEDGTGAMWVATGGLQKYDRDNDRFIRYQEGALCFLPESDGTLWIGGGGGLKKLDPRTGVFTQIEMGDPKTIRTIADDHAGNLWLSNMDEVIRLNKNTLQSERLPASKQTGEFHQVFSDGSIVWVAGGGGLFRLDPGRVKSLEGFRMEEDSVFVGSVNAVCSDSAGRIWFGTSTDGLKLLDPVTNTVTTYKYRTSEPRSLGSSFIEVLYVDRQGNLWIGTSNGVSFLSNWRKKFRHIVHNTDNPNSVVDGEVQTIMEDSHGDRWIGTFGGGLSRWDHRTGILQNYKQEGGLAPWLFDLYEDRNGTVWIGSNAYGGLLRWNQHSKTFSQVSLDVAGKRKNAAAAILEDSHGGLWVGTGDGVCAYDRRTGGKHWYALDTATSRFVWEIYEDHQRRVWLSTSNANGGLYEYDRVHDRFVRRHDVNPWSMHEDRTNRLWLGTSEGLMLFDRNADSLLPVLTDSTGLNGEDVYGILEDTQGNLWLSTNKGLAKYNPDSRAIRNYGINDGYPFSGITHQSFGYHGYCRGRNGEMMFGVGNGFVVFHPDSIRDNPNVPPIVITDFKLFNESVGIAPDSPLKTNITEAKFISLFHHQNIISFSFAALDYTITANNKYAYRLEGFDEDWVHVGTRNFAQYTNLSPGEYTFKVKGSNSDGVWNEQGVSLAIIITPPWWKTIWAYVGYALAIAGVLYTIRRSEKNRDRLKHQAELEHARAESLQEVDSLKSRFFANISHEFRTPLTLILGPIAKWKEASHPESRSPGTKDLKSTGRSDSSLRPDTTNRDFVQNDSLFQDLNRDMSLAERNAQRLLRLINQLLDLSKLDSGAMKLRASRGNIVPFVKGLASSFESSADMRRVAVSIHAESDEIEVYFDKDKMEKILTNLLSNAFKFTPEGGAVRVSISRHPERVLSNESKGGTSMAPSEHASTHPTSSGSLSMTREGYVSITIADTGIGIPADELPRVFDRFYQVDSSQTREHEGSGIGLALTKELVELHHGTISVKSEVGRGLDSSRRGTEFMVLLPFGRGHLKDDEVVEEPSLGVILSPAQAVDQVRDARLPLLDNDGGPARHRSGGQEESATESQMLLPTVGRDQHDKDSVGQKPLVLIVEDNADVRAYMREYLVTCYDVQEAHDGAEGIEKAKEIIPDLIISDVMMPKKDGYQLCKTLKLDEKTSHIPIILLTAKAGTENKIEGLETGADDYLTKPFDAKELLVRVKNLIDLRRKLRERFSVGQVLKPGDIAVTSVDDVFLKKAMSVVEQRMSDEEFGVEQLRDELGMSRTQLHRKLTALTNQSAGDFIRYMRLQRAKDLLTKNAGTVSEIAYQVGFSSVAYFTKCFREQFGVVPSEVRNSQT